MPAGIFIMFAVGVSRTRRCLSRDRINRTNVRNAALILRQKIFFLPNSAAGRDCLRAERASGHRCAGWAQRHDPGGSCLMKIEGE